MASDRSTSFGRVLRGYRLAANLTQEELAERAGLSARGVSDLERGLIRSPRPETARLLAAALALPPPAQADFLAAARGTASPCESPAGDSPAERSQPPLVGRDAERGLIDRCLSGIGPPLLVFAGSPGIGKSRLLQAAAARGRTLGFGLLAGGCAQRDGQEPFAPLVEALERRIDAEDADRRRRLLRGCPWLVRLLPELADGPIEPLPDWDLTPAQESRQIARSLRRFLENAAGPSGALLILDDLQWASGDALDMIAALMRRANGSLRVVVAYRDNEIGPVDPLASIVANLTRGGLAARCVVTPLPDAAAGRLLDALSPGLAVEARASLLRRADGIPFFLVSGAQAMRAGEPADAVPWDVAQSIQQRTARLPAAARSTLAAAAVMGRRLAIELLPLVIDRPEPEVAEALDVARRARLLEPTPDGGLRFAHDVIREVIETDLGAGQRVALHRRIAAILEGEGAGAGIRRPVEQLAYHCARAGETERAIVYFVLAADRAHAAGALQAEAALLGQAIALAERGGRETVANDLRVRRGQVHFERGRWDDARIDLEAGLDGPPLDDEARCRTLVTLAMVCHWLFDVPSTRRYGGEAKTLAERLDRRDLVAQALTALAFADSSDGDIGSSLDRYRRAWDLAGPRHRRQLAPGAEMHSLVCYWRGDYAEAVAIGREALRLGREIGDVTSIARALGNVGLALTGAGDYAAAGETFRGARRFCRQHDLRQWLARSIAMDAGFHLAIFDFTEAEARAEEARELSRSIGWPLAAASSALDLVLTLARQGDSGERAERLAREAAEAAAAASGAHGWLWLLRLATARAELAVAQSDWETAIAAADEAIRRARHHGRPKYEAFGLTARGRAAAGAGRLAMAREDLAAAVGIARVVGDPALALHAAHARLAIDDDERLRAEARTAAARILAALPDAAQRRRVAQAEPVRDYIASPTNAGAPSDVI